MRRMPWREGVQHAGGCDSLAARALVARWLTGEALILEAAADCLGVAAQALGELAVA